MPFEWFDLSEIDKSIGFRSIGKWKIGRWSPMLCIPMVDTFSFMILSCAGHENLHNSVDEALLLKVLTKILDS